MGIIRGSLDALCKQGTHKLDTEHNVPTPLTTIIGFEITVGTRTPEGETLSPRLRIATMSEPQLGAIEVAVQYRHIMSSIKPKR